MSAIIWFGCQKETVEVQIHPALQEQWTFSTDDFVDWSDIYDLHIENNSIAKDNSQKIRSANDEEADMVQQIFSDESMSQEINQISQEIGVPDWSLLMAFEHGSALEEFELFVPVYDNQTLQGILSITGFDDEIVIRTIKRNTLDHLIRDDVDRDLVLHQIPTISAFNIFDKVQHNYATPNYQWWYDEVFSEGFTKSSEYNAKCYVFTRTVWESSRHGDGDITMTDRQVTYTSYVDCGIPDEPQDPFGTNSADYGEPITLTVNNTSSGPVEKLTPIRTYVDLSPFKPVLDEKIKSKLDEHPCAKAVVDKLKSGIFDHNAIANAINEIFDTNDEVNLTIDAEPMQLSNDGFSTTESQVFDGELIVKSFVTLNENLLNSSQDFILSTLFHEMIHSYVDYHQALVNNGDITQAQFDNRFPLFSETNQGHENMAFNYLNVIKEILRKNNPSLTSRELDALSTAGISNTHWVKQNYTSDELKGLHDIYESAKGINSSISSTNFIKCN